MTKRLADLSPERQQAQRRASHAYYVEHRQTMIAQSSRAQKRRRELDSERERARYRAYYARQRAMPTVVHTL